MLSFEFLEKFFDSTSSALSSIFQALANSFASVRLRSDVQQSLVCFRVLNHRSCLSIDSQYDRALTLFNLLEKLARAATETSQGLDVSGYVNHEEV